MVAPRGVGNALVERVPDIPHGADAAVEVATELGANAPDQHIDGSLPHAPLAVPHRP
jgi:hypothetical protein